MIDFVKIKKLNDEIQLLIKERPELQELQDEINLMRQKVGKKNRLAAVQSMMINKSIELSEKLKDLVNTIKDLKK